MHELANKEKSKSYDFSKPKIETKINKSRPIIRQINHSITEHPKIASKQVEAKKDHKEKDVFLFMLKKLRTEPKEDKKTSTKILERKKPVVVKPKQTVSKERLTKFEPSVPKPKYDEIPKQKRYEVLKLVENKKDTRQPATKNQQTQKHIEIVQNPNKISLLVSIAKSKMSLTNISNQLNFGYLIIRFSLNIKIPEVF